jgi:nucleotide-binding universal stress UspA family protein
MSLRTLLVHLDASERCAARVALAATLAQAHGSRVVGLATTGTAELPLAPFEAMAGAAEWVARSTELLRETAQAQAARFTQQMSAQGLADHEARVDEHDALNATVQHGRYADLVIVGQTDRSAPMGPVAWDFPQQLLLNAGRPVLVVPHSGRFTTIDDHAVVAWKDTRETVRALSDALPLLHRTRRVTLLSLTSPSESDNEPDRPQALAAAQAWLAQHGIEATVRHEVTVNDTGNALLSRVSDLGGDLLVMGGYGHTRLRELLLGGATRQVLQHMTVPVLMSH